MSVLSAIGAWILGVLSKDVLSWLANLISTAWANYKSQQDVAEQAAADAAQLAAAKTQADKDAAANAISHDTFDGGST